MPASAGDCVLQVVKMFAIVVLVFAVSWLPYHIYFIYTYVDNQITGKPSTQQVYLALYWLAMCNPVATPAIYFWMNKRQAKHC